jgi:hypothetical protein
VLGLKIASGDLVDAKCAMRCHAGTLFDIDFFIVSGRYLNIQILRSSESV